MSVVVVILQQHSGKNSSISLNFFCPFNTLTELKVGSYSYSALESGGFMYSVMSYNGRYDVIF